MTRALALALLAPLGCATAHSQPPPFEPIANVPFRLPADVTPTAYRLSLGVDPTADGIAGIVEIDLKLTQPRSTIFLHGRGLTVMLATVGTGEAAQVAAYKQLNEDGMAALEFPTPVGPGPVTISLIYSAPFGERNDGLYRTRIGTDVYAFTLFEATSARLAFPCFDEPTFKAPLDLTLEVPAGQVAAANTAIVSRIPKGSGGHTDEVRFATTAPLPTYLYAWVVGPFDVVDAPPIPPSAVRAMPLPLRGLAVKGHGPELADSLRYAAPTVQRLEEYFGSAFPYPKLDLVAVPDFGAGAMENAGLITYRDTLLLYREATAPMAVRRDGEVVHAHEMAHQWFGDLVTLAWWDDTWLNESFAEWLDYPIAQSVRPEFHYPLEAAKETAQAMTLDGMTSARQVRQPIEGPGDIQNAFDGITYSKGQAVIRMFERYLGKDVFQGGVRRYMAAHAQSTAVAADLLSALGEVAGKDVATPFRTFIDQAGIPLVDVALDCSGPTPRLALHQERYLPLGSTGDRHRLWQIPFCASYPVGTGAKQMCTLLTKEAQTVDLAAPSCPAWVHPNPDADGYYRWNLPSAGWTALSRAPLSDLDRSALAWNALAEEQAGALSFADAARILQTLVRDPEPSVGEPAMTLLTAAEDTLTDESGRGQVHAVERALYQPVMAEVGLAPKASPEDPRVTARRQAAVEVLTESAADPGLRQQVAALGKAYLSDLQGPAHPEAVEPSLAPRAIAESIRAEPARLEGLITRFGTEQDPTVRDALLQAFEKVDEEPSAGRIRDLTLDPRMRTDEVLQPLAAQLLNRHTRSAAWAWLQAHYAELIKRVDDETRAALPLSVIGFCSEADAQSMEAFFAPHLAEAPGSDRTLKQALETTRLCAAHAAAQRESAKAYFAEFPLGR